MFLEPQKRSRFAIYTRYSSEMQNELSLEAQEARCRQSVMARGGVVVSVFSDSARSGWSLERDGFKELCNAAKHGKFNAVMFWKFDRLARNHEHAVMIKIMLRHEYGLKLYCVEGFSEDEDDSPYTAMMEQMLAVMAAFYSKNLSSETKRGKKQRAMNGEYNGSVPPIGYILITRSLETIERPAGLYIHLRLAAIVRRAFRIYATGKFSDCDIAQWMNARREIQKLRDGKIPINKEMVRDMLQNRIYTGRVPYSETFYSDSLGQGKQSSRKRKEWFEGKHEGFISDELFEACQAVRRKASQKRRHPEAERIYLLSDWIYCARCFLRKPTTLADARYGKMRPAWEKGQNQGRYRCVARERGYVACGQQSIVAKLVDTQVKEALSRLVIPDGVEERIAQAVQDNVENGEALAKINGIRETLQRIDFSWEKGILTPEAYIEKRNKLLHEIYAYQPVQVDDLNRANDLLSNFLSYWDASATDENPDKTRKALLAQIVDRVFVYDKKVMAIAIQSQFSIVLDNICLTSNQFNKWLKSGLKESCLIFSFIDEELIGHV